MNSTQTHSPEASSTPVSLSEQLASLSASDWAKFGAGAGLVLTGSGLISLGGALRLAAVAGGAVLAYRTLAAAQASNTTDRDAATPDSAFRKPQASTSEYNPSPSPTIRSDVSLPGDGTLASGQDEVAPGPAVVLSGA